MMMMMMMTSRYKYTWSVMVMNIKYSTVTSVVYHSAQMYTCIDMALMLTDVGQIWRIFSTLSGSIYTSP
jgi:hypothetical protein